MTDHDTVEGPEQTEMEGMPAKTPPAAVLTFLGAKTEPDRAFKKREPVRFEVHGYVREKGERYLDSEDTPVQNFVKIQVTSIKEI